MNDKKSEHKGVFAVTERDGKSFWTRVGVCLPNRDGSMNILLDALPTNAKLQIREDERRDDEETQSQRADRNERRPRR